MSVDLVAPGYLHTPEQERMDRLEAFRRAWTAYEGDAPKPLTVAAGDPDDNVRLNFNRLLVDKGASFLFGQQVKLGFEEDRHQEAVRDFLRVSGGGPALRKWAKNGAVTGHAFLKLMGGPEPRMIVLDPSNCEPEFDDEDIDKLIRFTISWNVYDRGTEQMTVRRQRIEPLGTRWEIIDEVSDESGDHWRELSRETWPFEWMPIFHCQNLEAPNQFWGQADLEPDVLDLVETLEKIASDIKRIVRLHGHPWPYVTGATASDIEEVDRSIDSLFAIDGDGVTVGQLEMKAALEGPLSFWKQMKSALHELTRFPEVAAGKVEQIGNLSGLALKVLYGPLVEKTDEKRDTYGATLIEICSRALELKGLGKDLRPSISWPEIVPDSPLDEAMFLETAQRMEVVSKQTIAERLDLDWDVEKGRIAEEGGVPSAGLVPDPLAVMAGGSNANGAAA